MTSSTGAGKTPSRVAKLATTDHAFARGQTDLIGLFGPQNKMSALIRTARGAVKRVEIGETLSIGRIVAIDDKGVMLSKNGQNRRLSLPAS
ncbi:hypothetical protein [Sedimentitalea todarodis]|uniref:Pilus assembly protein PilP n=1 Tax=Sedimentitalea todarodis TaxID=1631240 RepID=A0ABU3V9I5_9RHOB|nr:hypothetical protein [Sedimentitalea todarodis]MDU9002695.1 hypothetical protein [Sedimentitalea todarodis]